MTKTFCLPIPSGCEKEGNPPNMKMIMNMGVYLCVCAPLSGKLPVWFVLSVRQEESNTCWMPCFERTQHALNRPETSNCHALLWKTILLVIDSQHPGIHCCFLGLTSWHCHFTLTPTFAWPSITGLRFVHNTLPQTNMEAPRRPL